LEDQDWEAPGCFLDELIQKREPPKGKKLDLNRKRKIIKVDYFLFNLTILVLQYHKISLICSRKQLLG
jgi:hypothetical protein